MGTTDKPLSPVSTSDITSSSSKPKEASNSKSLLAAYFWGVLSAFGLLSMYLAVSSADTLPKVHHQYQDFLEQSKVSLSQLQLARQQAMEQTQQTQNRNPHHAKQQPLNQKEQLQHQKIAHALKQELANSTTTTTTTLQIPPQKKKMPPHWSSEHPLAGLSCQDHGGPSDELAQEMVYWQDIPSDNKHQSPFYAPNRYLTFEPDHGGWNNIRMSMETVVALAYAMGRTLVLPPAQMMYLLNKNHNGTRPHFSFDDFFDMPTIHAEHNGFDIISAEEFMKRQYADPAQSGIKNLPRNMQTNWDTQAEQWFGLLHQNVKNLIWDPNHCIAYFPEAAHHDTQAVQKKYHEMLETRKPEFKHFVGQPQAMDAPEMDRLAEFSAERETLCLYSPELQQEPVLHFPAVNPAGRKNSEWDPRLLVQFYQFLFFANPHDDVWMKRFVRDHVRYTDEIQCAAGRVVAAMREKVRTVHKRPDGLFHAIHCRRGDFQYKVTRVEADEILRMTQRQFQKGDVVFIATDQGDKSFFAPLAEYYNIYFLDDFIKDGTVGKELNPNFYGMIDQLVASRGKIFFGCWFSTFTGFINRLRGYHSQINKDPGYDRGKLMSSFYYALEDRYDHMLTYYPIKKSFYAREFPAGWRLLNWDVNVTAQQTK